MINVLTPHSTCIHQHSVAMSETLQQLPAGQKTAQHPCVEAYPTIQESLRELRVWLHQVQASWVSKKVLPVCLMLAWELKQYTAALF